MRGGKGGREGGCYLAISSNIRNRWASIRGTFFLSAFFAASCRSLASDPRSKGRVKPVSAIRFRDDDAIFVKKEIVRGNESMLSDFFFQRGRRLGLMVGRERGGMSFCFLFFFFFGIKEIEGERLKMEFDVKFGCINASIFFLKGML